MKKTIAALLLFVCILFSAIAGDFRVLIGDVEQHPDLLWGIIPTYATVGVGYTGLTISEGNKTDIQLFLGGGYIQRKLWQDIVSGEIKPIDPPLIYNTAQVNWKLQFSQGFLTSAVPDTDLLTAYISYDGKWERNEDAKGAVSINSWAGGDGNISDLIAIYPDLEGYFLEGSSSESLFSTLTLGLTLNMMEDLMYTQDGYLVDLAFQWAPGFLNSTLSGKANFYSITLNGVYAKTFYELTNEQGKNLFSIALVNRTNLNWTDGSKVPVWAQRPVSLGRKMRGYTSWTYATNFTAVNNLDIRFSGPDAWVSGLFPRINVFLDMGVASGYYFNQKNAKTTDFLVSCGAQITLSIFDFVDLGYEIAWISGENYAKPASSFIGSVVFFLDF